MLCLFLLKQNFNMTIPFSKYQGTGNDFVMIDNRSLFFPKNNTKLVKLLCDRKFGIGADGLILLEEHTDYDFEMVYYNADGNPSSMCGNGGRCLVSFAKELGIIKEKTAFMAVDGVHLAHITGDKVHLKMSDVDAIKRGDGYFFLNTGSPHHVQFEEDLDKLNVKEAGAKIRYGNLYGAAGSNINFMKKHKDGFAVRTYERGVEDETLSCGTGVTAVALVTHYMGATQKNLVNVKVEGGELAVSFHKTDTGYTDIYLIGPAQKVFDGVWLE